MSVLVLVLTFGAAALVVAGIASVFADLYVKKHGRMRRRLEEEFHLKQAQTASKPPLFRDVLTAPMEIDPEVHEDLSWRERLRALVAQSGLPLTVRRLFLLMLGSGLICGLLGYLLTRSFWALPLVSLAASAAPFFYVLNKRNRRLNRLLGQLPDAFDLMARAIRAGQTISQGMLGVGEEFDDPLATEMSHCYEQMNLGLAPELALRDLAQRTGVLEVKVFVLALLIQKQTGGNLAELLEKLAHLIRERFRIQGKIRAFTAEGRFQAAVLLVLPPLVLVGLMLVSPKYMSVLLAKPGLLVAMLFCELLGALWIRKIVTFDF